MFICFCLMAVVLMCLRSDDIYRLLGARRVEIVVALSLERCFFEVGLGVER